MSDIQHIESHTPDLTEENVDKLAALFPDVLTEITDPQTGETKRAIDFDALRDKLGDVAESTRERYQFTWPGKRAAKAEARKPISKTLRPVKERSKDWDTTQNLYIEGDNLDALKILRETYAGKIKLIYIDPPYNTGHDFIYKDNYGKTIAEDKAENGDWDDEGGQLVANPESNGRFHSDWCSMIYPRLLLARDLLTSDGIILISINDCEQENLKKICDEVFGASNFITQFIWEKTQHFGRQKKNYYNNIDYILCYSKQSIANRQEVFLVEKIYGNLGDAPLYNASNNIHTLTFPEKSVHFTIPDGTYSDTTNIEYSLVSPVHVEKGTNSNKLSLSFKSRWSQKTVDQEVENGTTFIIKSKAFSIRAIYGENKTTSTSPRQLILTNKNNEARTISRYGEGVHTSENATSELNALLGGEYFSYPKPVSLIEYFVSTLYDSKNQKFNNDCYILDFFSGSATTAHAVMKANVEDGGQRKFIMIQLPEQIDQMNNAGYKTICDLGEDRIRRAGEKIKAEIEEQNAQLMLEDEPRQIPDIGFRVLCVDSSSYEDVRKTPAEYTQDALDLDDDNTKEGRSSLDLLFECLPTFQLPYTSSIETLSGEPFAGYTVYSVNGGQLLACFDADIPESLIRGMADFDPKPSYVVVSEKSLPDSAARTNFTEIFKQSANAFDGQTQIRII